MRTLLVAAALASLADAAAADTALPRKPAAPTAPWVLATFERTACRGICPAYRLTIWSDGRVEWEGRQFVKVRGNATARLGKADLDKLRAAFAAARYFDLRGDFACRGATDGPSASITYNDGLRSRAIAHYLGCRTKGVDALHLLEWHIDIIVDTDRWIGTQVERIRIGSDGRLD